MHQSLYKKPSISTVISEEQRYSVQQMHKIQQSNHKLDRLEEKMKSLLEKDNKYKYRTNTYKQPSQSQSQSDQLNTFFQSSKKYKHTPSNPNQHSSDDMLLQNNPNYDSFRPTNHIKNHQTLNKQQTHHSNQQIPHTNRQKSSSSLKIFKKSQTKNKNQLTDRILTINQPNDSTVQRKQRIQISNMNSPLRFEPTSQKPTNNYQSLYEPSQPLPLFSPMNMPNKDIHQINQLQLMMQKSIQIKEKQLIMAQQELHQLQTTKIDQYRKNMQLEIQLQKLLKLKQQLIINPQRSLAKENQPKSLTSLVIEEISAAKSQLLNQKEKLLGQLKQLDQQEYSLKLEKKRFNFEFETLEKEFHKILKARNNRMKENIQQNYQIQKLSNNQDNQQTGLTKKYPSSKTFKTQKKHLILNFEPRHQSQIELQKSKGSIRTHKKSSIRLVLSKEKHPTRFQQNSQPKAHRVSKSTSCSVINRNRHTLAQCQQGNKQCETDKILISMVHQLDKLKQIVNKQIVKTRNKNTQRRVIKLYDNNRQDQISLMR